MCHDLVLSFHWCCQRVNFHLHADLWSSSFEFAFCHHFLKFQTTNCETWGITIAGTAGSCPNVSCSWFHCGKLKHLPHQHWQEQEMWSCWLLPGDSTLSTHNFLSCSWSNVFSHDICVVQFAVQVWDTSTNLHKPNHQPQCKNKTPPFALVLTWHSIMLTQWQNDSWAALIHFFCCFPPHHAWWLAVVSNSPKPHAMLQCVNHGVRHSSNLWDPASMVEHAALQTPDNCSIVGAHRHVLVKTRKPDSGWNHSWCQQT